MDVADIDVAWLLISTVRYSLGRMSSAPSLTAELATRYKAALTANQRHQVAEEIHSHLLAYPQTYDSDTWLKLAQEMERA